MRISGINKIGFRSVTPIFTKPGNLPNIEKQLKEKADNQEFELADSTRLYKSVPNTGGICWKAVNVDGLDVGLLVTGKQYKAWSFMEPGWTSETSPTRHIDKDGETILDSKISKKMLEKLTERINEPTED